MIKSDVRISVNSERDVTALNKQLHSTTDKRELY